MHAAVYYCATRLIFAISITFPIPVNSLIYGVATLASLAPPREALFPGLDLDSGLDWTLDWTLEKMYFWCHCSAKEASGPLPCPLEAQTLNRVHVSW